MREIRPSGSEGGKTELISLPYPYLSNSTEGRPLHCRRIWDYDGAGDDEEARNP